MLSCLSAEVRCSLSLLSIFDCWIWDCMVSILAVLLESFITFSISVFVFVLDVSLSLYHSFHHSVGISSPARRRVRRFKASSHSLSKSLTLSLRASNAMLGALLKVDTPNLPIQGICTSGTLPNNVSQNHMISSETFLVRGLAANDAFTKNRRITIANILTKIHGNRSINTDSMATLSSTL